MLMLTSRMRSRAAAREHAPVSAAKNHKLDQLNLDNNTLLQPVLLTSSLYPSDVVECPVHDIRVDFQMPRC
jgi:hypothetical protein